MAGAVMITLVDVGGRLTSAASKSQIIYAFLVPEGFWQPSLFRYEHVKKAEFEDIEMYCIMLNRPFICIV